MKTFWRDCVIWLSECATFHSSDEALPRSNTANYQPAYFWCLYSHQCGWAVSQSLKPTPNFHFAPSASTSFLPLQVISSWPICCWTCWNTQPHPGSSTCHRLLTTWARSSLMTWAGRRITTLSGPTHRASWPTSCLPESWPKGLRVGCVCVCVYDILYVCLYVSFCASLSLSLCVKNPSATFLPVWESHAPTTTALSKKQSEEEHVREKKTLVLKK